MRRGTSPCFQFVTQECSSVGRAAVSKTAGREFETLRSCHFIFRQRIRVRGSKTGPARTDAKKGFKEFNAQMRRIGVKPALSYLNNQNGGHVVWETGHQHEDKGKNSNEYKLAKALADEGYWVHLLPEKDVPGAVTLRLSLKGDKTYVDGSVKGLTGKTLYEQWSPTSANEKYGILTGLEHASDKGCKILALYDPTNILHQKHIETGMKKYAEGLGKKSGYIKLDGVVSYNARGEFHSWYWEDVVKKK